MKNISIFLFVLAICTISTVNVSAFKGKKTTLLFRNGLSHHRYLKVHCKSGNKDVPVQYMRPGTDWSFDFRNSFWGKNTLYWCTVSIGADYKVSKTFNAYVQKQHKGRGGSYNWWIKDDGIYHSNDVDFKLHKVYGWH